MEASRIPRERKLMRESAVPEETSPWSGQDVDPETIDPRRQWWLYSAKSQKQARQLQLSLGRDYWHPHLRSPTVPTSLPPPETIRPSCFDGMSRALDPYRLYRVPSAVHQWRTGAASAILSFPDRSLNDSFHVARDDEPQQDRVALATLVEEVSDARYRITTSTRHGEHARWSKVTRRVDKR